MNYTLIGTDRDTTLRGAKSHRVSVKPPVLPIEAPWLVGVVVVFHIFARLARIAKAQAWGGTVNSTVFCVRLRLQPRAVLCLL